MHLGSFTTKGYSSIFQASSQIELYLQSTLWTTADQSAVQYQHSNTAQAIQIQSKNKGETKPENKNNKLPKIYLNKIKIYNKIKEHFYKK